MLFRFGLPYWISLPIWKKHRQTFFGEIWIHWKKETIHPTHPYNFCQRFFFVHTNLKPWIAHNFFAWGRMQNIFTSSSAHFKTKIPNVCLYVYLHTTLLAFLWMWVWNPFPNQFSQKSNMVRWYLYHYVDFCVQIIRS